MNHRPPNPALLLAGLILVGTNLRPALSSVAPVLDAIRTSLDLSPGLVSLLTTAPVLCLGLFAPIAPMLGRRFGGERVIFAFLLLLAAGIGLRPHFGIPGLFAGTLLAGASIGVIGVLLPGIVKRDFPTAAGAMTGVYTMALCLGASLAAGLTVPLAQQFGGDWHPALAFWALPAVLAAAFWLPQLSVPPLAQHQVVRGHGLWRDPLAWQVTAYMGFQSSLAYIVFGWLPSILIARGLPPLQAGLVLSTSVMTQVVTALLSPYLATRGRDQRFAIALLLTMTIIGLMGILYAPIGGVWFWGVLLGLGQGGSFSIALALIVLRTRDPQSASELSSMSQAFGYALASLGPFATGYVHAATGSWQAAGGLFVLIGLAALLTGLGAGRARYVASSPTGPNRSPNSPKI
ncbi:putative transporter YycB [compost metagenome]